MIDRLVLPMRSSMIRCTTSLSWWLGVVLSAAIAGAGVLVADTSWASGLGLSPLTMAIVIGIVAGNTFFPKIADSTAVGVDYSKNFLLRAGIVLYGLRITFQQIAGIGWAGVLNDVVMLPTTFMLACFIGPKLFRLDRKTAMLIGAGSSICGAAAVLATEPVVKGQAYKVSVAVATVVVFGTLSMFLYPILYPYLGFSEHVYGIYAGSTIHEVAQVVAAGKSVGDNAAATAVIEKMLRVMMLAPFLLVLSSYLGKKEENSADKHVAITIPWFAVLFIVVSGINSLHVIPQTLVKALVEFDTVLLSTAMAALGLRTHVGALKQAGIRPLLLASVLFCYLIGVGWLVTHLLQGVFA